MNSADRVVTILLDGWLSDRWDDVKHVAGEVTGIGRDSYGMGKSDKNFKPSYGPLKGHQNRLRLDRTKPKAQTIPADDEPVEYYPR